jgi:hypothetical protein
MTETKQCWFSFKANYEDLRRLTKQKSPETGYGPNSRHFFTTPNFVADYHYNDGTICGKLHFTSDLPSRDVSQAFEMALGRQIVDCDVYDSTQRLREMRKDTQFWLDLTLLYTIAPHPSDRGIVAPIDLAKEMERLKDELRGLT